MAGGTLLDVVVVIGTAVYRAEPRHVSHLYSQVPKTRRYNIEKVPENFTRCHGDSWVRGCELTKRTEQELGES